MFPGTVTRHQHTRYVLNCYLVSSYTAIKFSNFHLNPERGINPSGSIKASLGTNKSIEIEWSPLTAECNEITIPVSGSESLNPALYRQRRPTYQSQENV